MGWSSGSSLAEKLWDLIDEFSIDEDNKAYLAINFIKAFEDFDCDTTYECKDLMTAALHDPDYLSDYMVDFSHIEDFINLEEMYGVSLKNSITQYKELNNERHLDNK